MTKKEALEKIEKSYYNPDQLATELLDKFITDLGNFFSRSQLEDFAEFVKAERGEGYE